MPNDERILETMPTGTLGLIPTASCMELGKKVDSYLSTWREHREHEHHNDIAFKEYHKESYIIEPHIPRFGSGEAKCVINQSVRGYDLYIMVDVTNYSMTYSLCGHTNHMSPDDHFADLKRVIAAVGGKARRITVILPFLYESRQHRRTARESLDRTHQPRLPQEQELGDRHRGRKPQDGRRHGTGRTCQEGVPAVRRPRHDPGAYPARRVADSAPSSAAPMPSYLCVCPWP